MYINVFKHFEKDLQCSVTRKGAMYHIWDLVRNSARVTNLINEYLKLLNELLLISRCMHAYHTLIVVT